MSPASNGGISFEEYLRGVGIAQQRHPDWRYGQALFNVLHEHRPNLADALRGGPLDPFYFDERADDFLGVVEASLA